MASFFAPAPRSRPGPNHDPPLVARRPTLRNPCRSSEPFRPPYGKSVAIAMRAEPTSSFRLAFAKRLPTSRQRFSGSERPRRLTGLEPRRTCATTGPLPCLARHVRRKSNTRSRAEQHQVESRATPTPTRSSPTWSLGQLLRRPSAFSQRVAPTVQSDGPAVGGLRARASPCSFLRIHRQRGNYRRATHSCDACGAPLRR